MHGGSVRNNQCSTMWTVNTNNTIPFRSIHVIQILMGFWFIHLYLQQAHWPLESQIGVLAVDAKHTHTHTFWRMLYPEHATCWLSDDVKWVGELYPYCKLSMSMSIASYQVLRMAPAKCCHDNTVCSLSEYATCIWFVKYSQLAFGVLQLKFNNSTYILITVLVGTKSCTTWDG